MQLFRDLPGWLQVVLGVVTLLVTVGGTGAVIHATGSQHLSPTPSPSPLSTPPVATTTAVAPSAATASSSPGAPPPATPPVIFDDQVSFSDINFDVNPPKAVDLTSGAPYTLDYESGGTMAGGILSASTGASEAIWTAASPPSYAQCRQWATTNAGSGQDVIQNGMQLCVEFGGRPHHLLEDHKCGYYGWSGNRRSQSLAEAELAGGRDRSPRAGS